MQTSTIKPINRSKKLVLSRNARTNLAGYLFISPWILGFLIFTAGPMLVSLVLTISDFNYLTEIKWVGLKNFKKILFDDYFFWQSVKVTFKYVFIREPLKIIVALAVALLLNQLKRHTDFFRTLFYAPAIVGTGVAVAIMWRAILSYDGLINQLLGMLGIEPVKWLTDPRIALYSLIIASLYGFPGAMIIFLAGLKDIPTSMYEAAKIDGAGSVSRFLNITLPLLSPVVFFNAIMGIINGFQTFTSGYVITDKGGPVGSTMFYMINLYQNAFVYHKAGYASALAWILFVIILLFTVLVFRSSDLWVFYESSVKDTSKKERKRKHVKN